jgi:hypothetical protein
LPGSVLITSSWLVIVGKFFAHVRDPCGITWIATLALALTPAKVAVLADITMIATIAIAFFMVSPFQLREMVLFSLI